MVNCWFQNLLVFSAFAYTIKPSSISSVSNPPWHRETLIQASLILSSSWFIGLVFFIVVETILRVEVARLVARAFLGWGCYLLRWYSTSRWKQQVRIETYLEPWRLCRLLPRCVLLSRCLYDLGSIVPLMDVQERPQGFTWLHGCVYDN